MTFCQRRLCTDLQKSECQPASCGLYCVVTPRVPLEVTLSHCSIQSANMRTRQRGGTAAASPQTDAEAGGTVEERPGGKDVM